MTNKLNKNKIIITVNLNYTFHKKPFRDKIKNIFKKFKFSQTLINLYYCVNVVFTLYNLLCLFNII